MIDFDKYLTTGFQIIKKYKIVITIILVTMIIAFILSTKIMDSYWRKFKSEYIKVEDSVSISGNVSEHYSMQGASYIILNDKTKYVLPPSRNYSYTPYDLCNFIVVGDSLSKLQNTDSLFIYREARIYIFSTGQAIKSNNE